MGAVTKFKDGAIVNQLRHVKRQIEYPKNKDIDLEKRHLNYSLLDRSSSPYSYFKKRIEQVYVRKGNINLMAGWVITQPQDLSEVWEEEFFQACYEFLKNRYGGEKNVISAEVHKDESGQPHMHFCFIPTTKYIPNINMIKVIEYLKKHPEANNSQVARALNITRKTVRMYRNCTEKDIKTEKVSAREVINRKDLITFHDDLQNFLNSKGIPAKVKTGITKKNGGNRTVEEMKAIRDVEMQNDIDFTL